MRAMGAAERAWMSGGQPLDEIVWGIWSDSGGTWEQYTDGTLSVGIT